MPSFQLTKATFMSPDHRAFVELVRQQAVFEGWHHRLILWLIPLLPGTDIRIAKQSHEVIGGLMPGFSCPIGATQPTDLNPEKPSFKA